MLGDSIPSSLIPARHLPCHRPFLLEMEEEEGLPCPPVDPQSLRPGRLRSSLLQRLNTALAKDPNRFSSLSVEVDHGESSRRRNSESAISPEPEAQTQAPLRSRTFDVADTHGDAGSESWSQHQEEEWLPDAPPTPDPGETPADPFALSADDDRSDSAGHSVDAYISPISIEAEATPNGEAAVPLETAESPQLHAEGAESEPSLTPVRESSNGRSMSFSYSESGAKLYNSIRKYYSLGSKHDNDHVVRLFEHAESPGPEESDSSALPDLSSSLNIHSTLVEQSEIDSSAELDAPGDEGVQEEQLEDEDRSAEVYQRYRSLWSTAALGIRVAKPVATAVSFGAGKRSSSSALLRTEKRTSTFDRLHGSYAHTMQKRERKRLELEQLKAKREAEEVEVTWQLGEKSREITARSSRYAEGE